MTATDKRNTTNRVLGHIRQVREALDTSRNDGFNGEGAFLDPNFQAATLRQAREELENAIKIIEQSERQ